MILSMKPTCDITPNITKLINSISISLGEVNANFLHKQSPQLRMSNSYGIMVVNNTISK
jgi:hypothetical protein